jgi:alkanesulfonate monooxygenase SsuD/methylene tetrahydromethanopterin reductase-like flavin-dependent oxidoreductase (luciferase family)
MNPVQFGVFIAPHPSDITQLLEHVHAAEGGGFDFVSIQDHPYSPAFLDTFALIGTLIGQTSRLRFMPDVANLPLRPPATLARASATLDVLSGGRFELGLGGGRLWPQIAALGGPVRSPGEVVTSVEEAITVIRALWVPGQRANFRGQHYSLNDAQTGPAPAHNIGIWLGAAGPRMLNLLGRKADGWIAPLSTDYDTKPAAQNRIDAAARAAGRNPTDIRRVIQPVSTVTDRPHTTERPQAGPGNQPIRTTPDGWARIIAEFVHEDGFDTINFVLETESAEQITRFATEVIPAARTAIASTKPGRHGPLATEPTVHH